MQPDIEDVIRIIGSFDPPFVQWRRSGAPAATAQALEWFWSQPDLAAARQAVGAQHTDWNQLANSLLDLAGGRRPSAGADWRAVVEKAASLGPQDRLAAAAAALYGLAGWQGELGGDEQPVKPVNPGWFYFPPRVAEILLDAEALRGAAKLSLARHHLEWIEREVYGGDFQERMEPYRRLSFRLAARWREDIAELAWDLRAACGPGEPNLRPGVAALLWAGGDAARAELLADDPGYMPALGTLRDLVEASVPGIGADLLGQHVWLALKDRPPLNLRRHGQLFSHINTFYRHTALHRLDDLLGQLSPNRVFAAALIAYFERDGSDSLREAVTSAWASLGDLAAEMPLAALQYRAVCHLVAGTGDWWQLAAEATEMLRDGVRSWDASAKHRWLDLPLYYLDGDEPRALHALEAHRVAALDYSLAVAAPPAPPAAGLEPLLEQETALLDELRAARFILSVPSLPGHYRHFTVDMRTIPGMGLSADDPPVFGDYDAMRFLTDQLADEPHPLDQDAAADRMQQTWADLGELWQRMTALSAAYARWRSNPQSGVADFAVALTAPAHRSRPVGPTLSAKLV